MSVSEDIYNFLTFPSSQAFQDYHPSGFTINLSDSTPSGSPPRKTPRLDADVDSASASRSRLLISEDPIGSATVKKGTIRIQLVGGSVPVHTDKHFDTSYALLKRALRVLLSPHNTSALPATYERIYTACQVCVPNRGEGLFGDLKLEVQKCVGEVARRLLEDAKKGVEWIGAFVEACVWFERQVGLVESLFAYLDRTYINTLPESSSIRSLCYEAFADSVFREARIALHIQDGISAWITHERTSSPPAVHPLRKTIIALITHLRHHAQYADHFEAHFLSLTTSFYKAESAEKAVSDEDGEGKRAEKFLVHCEVRREQEVERAKEVGMPLESWGLVREKTDEALLDGRLKWLVNEALGPLMDAMSESGLSRMYQLFRAVDETKVFLDGWSRYIETRVKSIVTDKAHDNDMVQRLLIFKNFVNTLVNDTFAISPITAPANTTSTAAASPPKPEPIDDKMLIDTTTVATTEPKTPPQLFVYALSDAFRRGFKCRRNAPAEMLAKHLDKAMRKGQQGRKDEEFAGEMDKVLALYRFTDDKDVFRAFYHKALAKRLLLEKSASDDFEKATLKKLKEDYDPEFSMGDHMFTDLALSRDSMRDYYAHRVRQGDDASSQKLNVMVLQRSFWPFTAKNSDADLPIDMQTELTRFTAFYKLKHQGHKLDWDHSLGTATLRAHFSRGEKELSVSLYQALVLLLFNEEDTVGWADIKERTRIEDAELRRTLQSLALGKKRVLKKQPMGKEVHDTDVFIFNADFQDPAHRVHINSIQVKETAEESKKTQTLIESDRKHVLDAAIVRIMKGKKELHNEQLKALTIDAVKNHFVPNVGMIKDRIDELVEQEYLRRHDTDMNVFEYVA